MAKKSFNPFKMWGAYVGAVLGLVLYISELSAKGKLPFIARLIENIAIFISPGLRSNMGFGLIVIPVIMIVLGFLIGWGIHSWVRASK